VCAPAHERGCPDAWACACVRAREALLIQHAKRMRRTVLSFATSLAPPYFSTLSYKWHDFRNKVNEHKMSVLVFCITFIRNICHSKKNSVRYCHKYENVFVQSARYYCRILIKLEFSRQIFGKKLKYQVSRKFVQ
jgi:hypothetical protein